MSVAAIERNALRSASTLVPAILLAGMTTSLLVRLVPDVSGKPLHEDEAVAGLVSARPFGDMLHTVVLERGGAPMHFVLAHLALAVDPSPEALRWLSVVFALATVPLCHDLARRLAGNIAGVTAAALAATSHLLTVYGTFGRMYSLFAFASALAADIFVRALDKPRRGTAVAAAAAALLPVTVHPFGLFLLAAEMVVALGLWRGRNVRAALPVISVALLGLPLLLADLRLSDRYAPEAGEKLDGGHSAADAALGALGGAAGGRGVVLALFVLFAGAGAFALGRRQPVVATFVCLGICAPPAVLALAGEAGAVSDRLGPRHLVFMLPLWIGLAATGIGRLLSASTALTSASLLVAIILAAALAPPAISDPRTIHTGEREATAAPAAWLRTQLSRRDLLYPYSPLSLASLPEAADARGLPREPVALARATERASDVGSVFVSFPLDEPITGATVRNLRQAGIDTHAFGSWLVLRQPGSSRSGRDALSATADMLRRAGPIMAAGAPSAHAYLEQLHGTACDALRRLGSSC
jgi:dolichyl-phosphate-mannose-protein mannosyltransferase